MCKSVIIVVVALLLSTGYADARTGSFGIAMTFKALEQSGWTQKASADDEHFATIADQAIAPILDSVAVRFAAVAASP